MQCAFQKCLRDIWDTQGIRELFKFMQKSRLFSIKLMYIFCFLRAFCAPSCFSLSLITQKFSTEYKWWSPSYHFFPCWSFYVLDYCTISLCSFFIEAKFWTSTKLWAEFCSMLFSNFNRKEHEYFELNDYIYNCP